MPAARRAAFAVAPLIAAALLGSMWAVGHPGEPPRRGRPLPGRRTESRATTAAVHAATPLRVERRAVRRPPTIFISMAAFRDSEAADTLRDLFKKAARPRSIFVGVVCQRDSWRKAEQCLPPEWAECGTGEWCPTDQLRVRDFAHTLAKGPTYARFLAAAMYRGEDFFMMMDAHNVFIDQWDAAILRMYTNCLNVSAKCILSVYPMAWEREDNRTFEERPVAHLCGNAHWHHGGYPGPFSGAVFGRSKEARPQPFVGAGLVFGPGRMVDDVPFDPHLPFLFHGEEILLTVRLWTSGYDFFSPGENVLFHHYYRQGHPRMEALPGYLQHSRVTVKRVQYILRIPSRTNPGELAVSEAEAAATEGISIDLPRYGLGSKRPLARYWRFARMDPVTRTHAECNAYWCRRYAGHPPYKREWMVWANSDATTAPSPEVCEDRYPAECPGWKERGECQTNAGMMEFCQKSCGGCPTPAAANATT
eukprot:TRINITY_DN25299_c0_g1_i1.p1 TRINITY_DN25299_c0_g1~~TRINITY_DN25299_c0_g1_i1.p1  ORF type:complete len:506 (+),score=96.67 TRINITY_DN25299_c0_g1_i1:89-1519(+)